MSSISYGTGPYYVGPRLLGLNAQTPSPGGCSGQRACQHAQLGVPETAHGPTLEYHQLHSSRPLHSLTHTPSWVYRRRLTGRLWNAASCTHSLGGDTAGDAAARRGCDRGGAGRLRRRRSAVEGTPRRTHRARRRSRVAAPGGAGPPRRRAGGRGGGRRAGGPWGKWPSRAVGKLICGTGRTAQYRSKPAAQLLPISPDGPERGTNPTRSRRACTCEHGRPETDRLAICHPIPQPTLRFDSHRCSFGVPPCRAGECGAASARGGAHRGPSGGDTRGAHAARCAWRRRSRGGGGGGCRRRVGREF
jgi:hypothetical protein